MIVIMNNKFDVIEVSAKNFNAEIVQKFSLKPLSRYFLATWKPMKPDEPVINIFVFIF